MAQTYTADCFASGHAAQTDLANMEANFAALKSCFSGGSAPANTEAGMLWFDTTKHVQKQRNNADSAWVGFMHGDTSHKIWIYRDAAMDGWAIDGTVTDKVLALKGGTTFTTGAATAGTWTLSGFSINNDGTHTHAVSITSGTPSAVLTNITTGNPDGSAGNSVHTHAVSGNTGNTAAHNHGGGVNHDATWRIAAAVGTMQYLDL